MRIHQKRSGYGALAILTVALGLGVHLGAQELLPAALRDPLGDALWAAMVYWLIGAAAPESSRLARSCAALTFAYGIEVSQLYHTAWLDGIRATTIGHLVLGSDFDARDLVAYAIGVSVAALLDPFVARRS